MTHIAGNSSRSPSTPTRSVHLQRSLDGLLLGTLAALVVACVHLPALIPAGVSPITGFFAVAGLGALTLGPLVALRRGGGACPSGTRTLIVGTLAPLPLLALFGAVLFSGTHHRPLGAVTFAVLAAGVIVVGVVVARRLADRTRQLLAAPWAARFDWVLGFLWFGVVGVIVLLRAVRSPEAAPVFSAGWQLAAVVVAFVVASLTPWPRNTSPMLRAAGVFSWILLVATSIALVHLDRGFASVLLRTAPIVAWPWAGYR